MPKVSVVIPYFNLPQFIPEAVQSLLNQTFQDWEMILVDDGSPVPVETLVGERLRQDSRCRILRQENGGRARALNLGLAAVAADSQYFARLDADDRLHPTFLEELVAVLESSPQAGTVVCEMQEIHEDGSMQGNRRKNRWVTAFPWPRKLKPEEMRTPFISFFVATGQGPHALHRLSVIRQFGGFDLQFEAHEDSDFFINMALRSEMLFLDRRLYDYRRHVLQSVEQKELIGLMHDKLRGKWDNRRMEIEVQDRLIVETTWGATRFFHPCRDLRCAVRCLIQIPGSRNRSELVHFIASLVLNSLKNICKPLRLS